VKGGERPAWPSPRKRFECRPKSLSSMSVEVLVSWSCVALSLGQPREGPVRGFGRRQARRRSRRCDVLTMNFRGMGLTHSPHSG
jgi:hypothetical protein